MINLDAPEIWFVCGSQHLYGPGPLQQVAADARRSRRGRSAQSPKLPLKTVFKPLLTTPDEIARALPGGELRRRTALGSSSGCTRSRPRKMWIRGPESRLQKPFVHLHTQFNRELPWGEIDMDFMNLNQSAHGDREAGFIHTRMRLARKVVVGHWARPGSARADRRLDARRPRLARLAGREVLPVRRQHAPGRGHRGRQGGGGDEVRLRDQRLRRRRTGRRGRRGGGRRGRTGSGGEYEERYRVAPELRRGGERHESLRYGARLELGLRAFLGDGGFKGFTTTFEDLHGLKQLPGLAPQRLMADGYGFGAEGDWKTAALVRAMKVMGAGLPGGTSFMEDYTYHLGPDGELVLGAHMLEVCRRSPTDKPSLEIHPLGIGGKEDPGPAGVRRAARTGAQRLA